jgi:hypothetical protein
MRREIALMLLPLWAAQGCASGGLAPRAGSPGGGGPADLVAVNNALADHPAIVELRGGEKVEDVEDVRMTAESTSWRDGDQVRTVPTAEVSRVTRQVRRRGWSGLGWGILAGLPVGWLVASTQHGEGTFISKQQATTFVLTDVACGLVGMIIDGSRRHDQVVYAAAETRAGDAAAGGSASRHCRLAAEHAPPGSPAIDCAPAPAAP